VFIIEPNPKIYSYDDGDASSAATDWCCSLIFRFMCCYHRRYITLTTDCRITAHKKERDAAIRQAEGARLSLTPPSFNLLRKTEVNDVSKIKGTHQTWLLDFLFLCRESTATVSSRYRVTFLQIRSTPH
jgi:hypothetical protein